MALDMATFRVRAITALVFVAVMLGGLLFHPVAFRILIAVIMGGCGYELVQLLAQINRKKYSVALLLLLPYVIMPMLFLFDLGVRSPLTDERFSPLLPCAIIFSIWINDTMAYIMGSVFGKTALSRFSPKKTWEGTIGGILLSVIVITWLGTLIPMAAVLKWNNWMVIAFICAVTGTIGDLWESFLKRKAGVKDSGNIMPGHGGFLDRFDSLLFAAPAVWFYVKWML